MATEMKHVQFKYDDGSMTPLGLHLLEVEKTSELRLAKIEMLQAALNAALAGQSVWYASWRDDSSTKLHPQNYVTDGPFVSLGDAKACVEARQPDGAWSGHQYCTVGGGVGDALLGSVRYYTPSRKANHD